MCIVTAQEEGHTEVACLESESYTFLELWKLFVQ